MNLIDFTPFLILAPLLGIAVISDLRSRRIPNWLTYPAMMAGLIYHGCTAGRTGVLFSVEGIGLGVSVLIVPWLFGGMGAGDAKLMGAVGGVVGPKGVWTAFLCSAVIGGFYALMLLGLKGCLRERTEKYWIAFRTFVFTHDFALVASPLSRGKVRLCYGVAIALGTLVSISYVQ